LVISADVCANNWIIFEGLVIAEAAYATDYNRVNNVAVLEDEI